LIKSWAGQIYNSWSFDSFGWWRYTTYGSIGPSAGLVHCLKYASDYNNPGGAPPTFNGFQRVANGNVP